MLVDNLSGAEELSDGSAGSNIDLAENREVLSVSPGGDRVEVSDNPTVSSEDLSDGPAEDMVEDLHNLLFLHGLHPQPQGENVDGADGGMALVN